VTGSCRTCKGGLRQIVAVARFDVRQQLRDPLTTLYGLVFGLLAFGHTASDVVELVTARGGVPKTAPWALALAFGGLAAFGQVITTMISATAVLRDEALRARDLVATSGLGPRPWFAGHVVAALTVMVLVYGAMPIGAALGTLTVPASGASRLATMYALGHAFAVITLPTMVVVALLLTSVGVHTRRVMGVLIAALALVALWQLALSLEQHTATRTIGALLDPFANAPVLAQTRGWSTTDRITRTVALDGLLLWNRALWMLIALAVAGVSGWRVSWSATWRVAAPASWWPSRLRRHRPIRARTLPRTALRTTTPLAALWRFTARWILQDPAWKAVAALAVGNVLFNALVAGPTLEVGVVATSARLLLVQQHARLFLILLATVYAGEVIWRERDLRVSDLAATMPVARATAVLGRLGGLLAAQSLLALLLALVGLTVAWPAISAAPGALGEGGLATWVAWSLFVVWLPFLQLTVLSAAAHAVVNHKVAAHLMLITGWVLAVVVDSQTTVPWWVRFAEPALLAPDGRAAAHVPWALLAQRGAYWSAVSAALVGVIAWRWPRLTSR
jgi:ABC-2 type transport system permease protein